MFSDAMTTERFFFHKKGKKLQRYMRRTVLSFYRWTLYTRTLSFIIGKNQNKLSLGILFDLFLLSQNVEINAILKRLIKTLYDYINEFKLIFKKSAKFCIDISIHSGVMDIFILLTIVQIDWHWNVLGRAHCCCVLMSVSSLTGHFIKLSI